MLLLIQLIAVFVVSAVCAMKRWPLKIWAPSVAGVLLILSIFATGPWWFLIVCWIVVIASAVIFSVPNLRMILISKPLFSRVKNILPPLSNTEKTALEAGETWWEADLFAGRPDWYKLQKLQLSKLTDEEQAFLDNQVEKLCSMLDDYTIVTDIKDLPAEVWNYLKRERFLGIVIAKEYGGLGFSALAHSAIVVKIATRCISAAVTVMVPNSLGPGELITHYGTSEQKQYYLPRLAKGEEIPCFGLTGPEAGSDATALTDHGIICRGQYNGKEVLGMRLTYNKRYITLAPIATVIGLAVKLYDPDGLFSNVKDLGITLCLVPRDVPGMEIGKRHSPQGLAFMNGPIRGKDVFVPLEFVIGGSQMIGQGWRMLMECLSIGRSISLPALSTATGILAYRMTGAYSRIRRQFNTAIGNFEGVEEVLAKIAGKAYLLESTRRFTASAVDKIGRPALASAITKYHLTELGRKVSNNTMDVHSGRGIQLGPRNYIGLGYHGVPLSITVEGANILTRNLIIFGQGAMICHPYVRHEVAAVSNPDQAAGLKSFDELLTNHIGYTMSNLIASLAYGLGAGLFLKSPHSELACEYRNLSRMSAALSICSDFALLILGGDLKRKERISARLGDVLSHLYLASSVIKQYEEQQCSAEDLPHVKWAVKYCLCKCQQAFDEFLANFPVRSVAWLMRILVFPLGKPYKKSSDKLDRQLAQKTMEPSKFRDVLTQLCYVGKNADDATGRIDQTFAKVIAAEPVYKKVHDAVRGGLIANSSSIEVKLQKALQEKIVTSEEVELVRMAERMRADAIAVDEFDKL